ncbi:hypothetical protein PCANC_04380 [Puccinia coronata f. sp. avenae]|uniref:Uncharacterized protein n=1 Tax=Puccinia coronata f. sp. avenae TaxID=200324 RepID=A0A2N5TGF8_9BASI|nr:hypothetical protein PCANC_04380 [Puccinia coronata f. sp. avenae]PLW24561.1 hypothetical protein PCASD_09181 [Puccinia coronata f. sp. avenae]
MSSLLPFAAAPRRLLPCVCLGLVALWASTTRANLTGHLGDSAMPDQYTTDDLFEALSPDHHPGVTPPEDLMWEGDGYQLCESDHPASEPPTPPESREELSERGNIPPASIQPVQASPSQHPDPSYDQVGGSDSPAHPSLASPNKLPTPALPEPAHDQTQDAAGAYEKKEEEIMNFLSKLRTAFQAYHVSPFYRSYFTPAGGFAIPLLGRQQADFKFELTSILNEETKKRLEHPDLLSAKLPVGEQHHVFEILEEFTLGYRQRQVVSTPCFLQPMSTIRSHYQNLLLFMHKIYEERLHRLDIPIVEQLSYQEKMFDWLFQEIFPSSDRGRLPGIGSTRRESLSEGLSNFNHLLSGPIHAKLKAFFSQRKHTLELIPSTALWLLERYQEQHETATHLLQTQSVDEAAHSRVGILVESLLQGIQATRGAGIDIRLKQDARVDNMVDPFIKMFEEQRDRFWEESSQVKYIHPTLRIVIIQSEFLERVHGPHQIQVLNSDHPSPIKKNHISKIMAMFLKRIDLLHYYLLYQFETSGKGIHNPDTAYQFTDLYPSRVDVHPTINCLKRTRRICLDQYKGN